MSFYKMDPAAWDFGTAGLSLEEEAAYLRIVNAIHKHMAGVPNNDRVLAGMFRVSTRKARALVLALVNAGKLVIEDGLIWNDRARSDLIHRGFVTISRVESGAKGGRTRAERAAKSLENNEAPKAIASSREEKRREEKNPPTPRKREGESDPAFERFWSAYPRKVAKPKALKAWRNAIKRSDPEAIIAAAPNAGDGGQFTPHPSTWLNQERWNDAPTSGLKTGWSSVDEYLEDSGIYDFDDPRHALNRRRARDGERNPSAGGHRGPRSDALSDDLPGVFAYAAQEAGRLPIRELV